MKGGGGTGGPGCGARGWWRGLAGLRDDAPSEARGADGERAAAGPAAAGPDGARNTSGTASAAQKSELLVVLRVLVGLAAVGAAKGADRSHLLG